MLSEKEREIRQRLKDDFAHYASKCLRIRGKEKEGFLVFNKCQKHLHAKVEEQKAETGKIRAVICKGRQMGISTYTGGRLYWRASHTFGCQAFILTHAMDATNNLYRMAQHYHDNCPTAIRPQITTNNAKELSFGGLNSGYRVGTAQNKSVGRSATIQLFHGSEVGFWENAAEHAKGIMQCIPNAPGTEVFLESTANGVGNYYHQQWQLAESGESDYIPIFLPWYWQEEYAVPVRKSLYPTEEEELLGKAYNLTEEQISWRRLKIIEFKAAGQDGVKAFQQEYPCNPVEAFQNSGEDNFIDPYLVLRARKNIVEGYGPLVIGVDPARFGDDRTAIVRRQGRKAFNFEKYIKKDTMQVTGIVHSIIERENPFKVCIDIGGLGAGVYDRLCELGHRDILIPVNSGESALDDRKYKNKRAEMWGKGKEWLENDFCQLPDSDEFQADICNTKYDYTSNNQLIMESKKDMKKRGIRSSDAADAWLLTFAVPATAYHNIKSRQSEIAQKITKTSRKLRDIRTSRNS